VTTIRTPNTASFYTVYCQRSIHTFYISTFGVPVINDLKKVTFQTTLRSIIMTSLKDLRGLREPTTEELDATEILRSADELARRAAAAAKNAHHFAQLYDTAAAKRCPVAKLNTGASIPVVGLGTWCVCLSGGAPAHGRGCAYSSKSLFAAVPWQLHRHPHPIPPHIHLAGRVRRGRCARPSSRRYAPGTATSMQRRSTGTRQR